MFPASFISPSQSTRWKFIESHPIAKIRPIDGWLQMNASQSAVRRLNCRRETGERGSKIVVQLLKVSERRKKKHTRQNIAKTFSTDQLRARLRDVQIVSDLRQSSSGIMKVSSAIVCLVLFVQSSKFVIDERLDFIRNISTKRLSALHLVKGDWRSRRLHSHNRHRFVNAKQATNVIDEFVARLFIQLVIRSILLNLLNAFFSHCDPRLIGLSDKNYVIDVKNYYDNISSDYVGINTWRVLQWR